MFTIQHVKNKQYVTMQPSLFFWTNKIDEAIKFDSFEKATEIADGLWKRKTVQGGVNCFLVSDKLIQIITDAIKDKDPIAHRVKILMDGYDKSSAKDGTLSSLLEVVEI